MAPSHIGRYEIQRRLGAGGMGALYLARDPALDRLVALKVVKDEYHEDAELRERFKREARSVARLNHRNIIIVYEIAEADSRLFIATDYRPRPKRWVANLDADPNARIGLAGKLYRVRA